MININNCKGFNNIGNTCYLNAGLQLIIHNKDLCNNILIQASSNPILNSLSQFILEYHQTSEIKSLTPSYIKDLVSSKNKQFFGSKQHDSYEFIIYFLDLILESIKEKNIYEIVTGISVKCKLKSCLNISQHDEKNNYLLLDINNETTTLDECYRNYKVREKLVEDNLYFCEKCNEKRIASKRTEIKLWPKHLIIVLKRFSYNGRSQKLNNLIDIPIEWRHNYKLKGIVFHSGSSFGGHYIYIGNYNNRWIMFDDSDIKEIKLSQLNNYKNYGYIYYFERSSL